MIVRSAPLCRRALLQYAICGRRRGDLLCVAEPRRRGAEDLEEGGGLPRSSGWRQAMRKVRAISAAGRLQNG